MRSSFIADALTPRDVAALAELARQLHAVRQTVATEWSHRLMAALPEYFPAGSMPVDRLASVNEGFLSLILTHIQRGDLQGLYEEYYARTRRLMEANLQRAPLQRISLGSLYTSARISLQVIDEHLSGDHDRLMLAYTKLTAQLMMLVGQAYSDCREDYLQRAFEQINTLSHELRAPLSHLFGYLELLRVGSFGTVSAEQERVLGDLIHETDDLLWLLTGTLDLSRLDTGRTDLRVEEFTLATMFTEVRNLIPHATVPLTWSAPSDPPLLRTDRIKLKQIVGNLVRNAVRYGGNSAVVVTATLPQPGTLEVSVQDRGPGIKPDDLRVIFDLFERGAASGLARDGYGIGLHVVRRLVHLLGGTIDVQSAPGVGSCFRVTIPLQNPE